MPSLDHDALIFLFHNQPALAARLLRDALHVELPEYNEIRLASSDLTEIIPAELRADAVILFSHGQPVLGVIVEVQLSRDERKRFTWPAYIAVLRARHECPVELLVIAPDTSVASWASEPIIVDLGATSLRPRVLGAAGIPVVADLDEAAREPELAVLSICAHGKGDPDTAARIALAAAAAVHEIPEDRRVLYCVLIEQALSDAARKAFEMLPNTSELLNQSRWFGPTFRKGLAEGELRGRAEGELRGRAEGELRGRAESVLDVLAMRGITVTEEQREKILAVTELEVVRGWVLKAAVVGAAGELFE